jgi:hypothetical protein
MTAGSPSFTLTATGVNFTPTTTLMWDSAPLATTYISSTSMRAQVPASLIAVPGTASIVPSPIETFNYGESFTVTGAVPTGNPSFTVSNLAVQANDMVWSQANSLLYLAVSGSDPNRPNSITSLDPKTGRFGSSIATNGSPTKLSVSSDGSYLYASFNSSSVISRYTLPALQSDIDIPLSIGPGQSYSASDLQVEPTNSRAVVVARIASGVSEADQGDVAVYDDTIPRPQTASSGTSLPIRSLLWNGDGQTLYGIDTVADTNLYIISSSSSGLQIKAQPQVNGSITGGLHFNSTTGNIYSDSGHVLDAGSAATVATFPTNALQSGFNPSPLMIPDSDLNIAYFLGRTIDGPGPGNYVIEAFDLTHFNLLGTASIPNVVGTPYKFVRWGSNGLAFLTTNSNGAAASAGVYLVTGGFVSSPAP